MRPLKIFQRHPETDSCFDKCITTHITRITGDSTDAFAANKTLPEIFQLDIGEGNMVEWLKTISVHDFTGIRAKAQWETQEFERRERLKRKGNPEEEEAKKAKAEEEN